MSVCPASGALNFLTQICLKSFSGLIILFLLKVYLSGDSYLPYVHDTRGDVALPYIHGGTDQ